MSQFEREEVLRYGEHQRGFGILTLPSKPVDAPILVIFNAGLLHRTEPYRLNVMVARALADLGITTLRVDLSGKGDAPVREGLVNRESVAADWRGIRQALLNRLGVNTTFILMGLCSGADNAIKLSVGDESVLGLVLIDAESPKDDGFAVRKLVRKITDRNFLLSLPVKLIKRLFRIIMRQEHGKEELISLRDAPTSEDLVASMQQMVKKNGRILAVFTNFACHYYNLQGQFVKALDIDGLDKICRERMWFDATHILPVTEHRERFLSELKTWFQDEIIRQ